MALLTFKALGCAESAYLNGMWEHDEGTGKMAFCLYMLMKLFVDF